MAKTQKIEYSDEYDDFDGDFSEESGEAYDLDFDDNVDENRKSRKPPHTKQQRTKHSRNARHRIEDYFERKALKDPDWNWNLDYD